jgi:hypothetical protein
MKNEDYLFGQYLIRFSRRKKADPSLIDKALSIQKEKDLKNQPHRRIGTILLEDFEFFDTSMDLWYELNDYHAFRKNFLTEDENK